MSARHEPATSSAPGDLSGRTSSRTGRWLAGAGVAAAVVAVVVAVQAAAGGPDADGSTPGSVASVAPAGLAGQLFGAETAPADVTRTTSDDIAGAWPIAGCATAAGVDVGRAEFASGTERGLEYSRDLAIGRYVDEAAARAAYDGVVARIAACADKAGSALTTTPADVGDVSSVSIALADSADSADSDAAPGSEVGAEAGPGAAAASMLAVARSGSVVVLAVDHADFYGSPPAESTAGTVAQAERLLAATCRAALDRC